VATKLNVLQKFTILSVIVTVVIVAGLGYLMTTVLTQNLLRQEAQTMARAILTVTAVDLPKAVFEDARRRKDPKPFEAVWEHFRRLPEVLRAKIYDTKAFIIWSDEPELVGKRYPDNNELMKALSGLIEVEFGDVKTEHEYERELAPEGETLEVYVPLEDRWTGRVYGVAEIYTRPGLFLESRRGVLAIVWTAGAGGGVLLFLSLFWLFRGALLEQRRLEAVERKYEAVEIELRLAASIQQELLPQELPRVPGVSLAARHHPSREVGGDYYDAFTATDGALILVIADNQGHGIPGALLMVATSTELRSRVGGSMSPADAVSAVNEAILPSTASVRFVSLFLGRYEPASRTLTYVNAGHLPGVLVRDGRILELTEGGLVLGVEPGVHYDEGRTQLRPGDALFLYTDGITEARDGGGEFFGEPRLKKVLRRAAGKAPEEVVAAVERALDEFRGDRPLDDDVAMLCLSVTA
jgi:serine phosphatase RsbU (regulator of sigma subunit)